MPQGETIIRPSSKGDEHLCYTWKVTNGIFQHVPVYDKLALGTSLWIGEKEYRNYDDIIVRHINPMISYAAELTNYKYYQAHVMGATEIAEQVLKEQKRANPNGIPYIVSAAKVILTRKIVPINVYPEIFSCISKKKKSFICSKTELPRKIRIIVSSTR